ncbi:MAG: hypothetical protein IKP95_11285 [Ruminococcus sp.]|nr:hypothetical protein [Ruminococcus sp.]
MAMDEQQKPQIFRQSSVDNINSPEQLTDYLRVTNPGVWIILAAVIVLIGGLFVWSMVGNLETVAPAVAIVTDSQATIIVSEGGGAVKTGQTVRAGNEEFIITAVETDDYGVVRAYAPVLLKNGKYDVKIVTESIHPIEFLFN